MTKPHKFQVVLPDYEMERLGRLVLENYRADLTDHDRRINRWAEYAKRWRAMAVPAAIGEEKKSNYLVPLIRWLTLAQLAKEADSMFGDDAEVVAVPQGPSDARNVHKIGCYMTWRVLSSMKLLRPFLVFVLRKIMYGKSIAYSPWLKETFDCDGKEETDYEGPGFLPVDPDDFIVPAEDVLDLHQFSHVIRRYRTTPDDMLDGEEAGLYQGIEDDFENITKTARDGQGRDQQGEQIKKALDVSEGTEYQHPISGGETLTILEWYGKVRMLKSVKKDDGGADEYDLTKREMRQTHLVVRVILETEKVCGIQKLKDLYPTKRKPRPFVESSFLVDGRYWPPGLCEMAIDMEDELTANHGLATEAAQFAVNPARGYRPASGFVPDRVRLEPGDCIALDNPTTDIRELTTSFNVAAATWKEQVILSYAERVFGLTDQALGRASDRPNAPRTSSGQMQLLEAGNERFSLSTKVLAEDMGDILTHIWELDSYFSSDQTFFRVTEEDANGLFDIKDGGSFIEKQDRSGRYDFKIKFATSMYSREADKQRTLQRYQLDIQNPLIATNPAALWKITNDVHKALGDPNFAQLVPQPPQGDLPIDPKQEWAEMQQGESVTVNPLDNDELHMMRHDKDLRSALDDPKRDQAAVQKLVMHYAQHTQQLQQKKIVQAIAEHAAQGIATLGQAGILPPGLMGGGEGQQQQAGPTGPPQQGGIQQ